MLDFLVFAIKLCSNMEAVFDIRYLSSDGNNVETDDIPQTKESVWILGKKYSAVQGTWNFNDCLHDYLKGQMLISISFWYLMFERYRLDEVISYAVLLIVATI